MNTEQHAGALGSDFLQLDPSAAAPRRVTDWLTAALRSAIEDGTLVAGARLPATRTLATDLGVARGVVVEAYRRLADEGLVAARTGVGSVVMRTPRPSAAPPADAAGPPAVRGGDRQLPRLPLAASSGPGPGGLDLSPGVPDLASFPRAAWLRAEREVLREVGAADLGYGDPRGSRRLREQLVGWLARTRGVVAEADGMVVVAGVAQSLALLAQVLRAGGAAEIAVEDPGSRGAREQLAYWGLRPAPVPVDDEGLQVEVLRVSGHSAVVVTPAHQFPTGVVLSAGRRRALLHWAQEGGLVVEDDYDAEHRYDRAPVRALQPSAPARVAHTGSTSKALAPGLRLGWLVPPPRLLPAVVAARHASDLGSPAIPQLVLARLLATGAYDRHLRLVRTRHRARRDAVLVALARHLPSARVEGVAAGLHLLVTFPGLGGDVDDADLAAAARDAGVLVHPLSWHRQAPGPPGLVVGYAAHSPDRLAAAVEQLAAALPARVRHRGNRSVPLAASDTPAPAATPARRRTPAGGR